LKRFMPITFVTMWIGTLAISGIFPLAGFFSKDEIIWYTGAYGYGILWGIALLAALLTAGYMTRLMVMTFHGENRTGQEAQSHLHEVPAVMWVPLAILAVLSIVGGWVNIPDALPGLPAVHALHDWLHPVFEPARSILEGHGVHAAVGRRCGPASRLWRPQWWCC
jgi:NADH-quinone oxidoreductase subunit L